MRSFVRTGAVGRLSKALAAAVVLAACGGGGVVSSETATSSSSGGRACVPGAQVSCACVGGEHGVQLCKADGSGLDACQGCATGSGGGTSSSTTGTGGTNPCGDTTSDANNCGACGHSCASGTCAASLCKPVTLYSGTGEPGGIVVDATNVYWTRSALGAVSKVKITGGAAQGLTSGQGFTASALAVDATSVYYLELGRLMKAPINGGASTMLGVVSVVDLGLWLGMRVDATSVYLLGTDEVGDPGASVVKVPIAGGSVTPLAQGGEGAGMVMDANSIYWIDSNTGDVLMVPISGGTPTTLVSGALPVSLAHGNGIALDATSVYWTNSGAGTVMKVPIGGGAPTTLASGGASANGMAVDATSVYWTDAVTNAVMKVPIGGGAMTVVATGEYPPFGIALDATNVYWTVPGEGAVLMLAK
jgi:hypothetical protein